MTQGMSFLSDTGPTEHPNPVPCSTVTGSYSFWKVGSFSMHDSAQPSPVGGMEEERDLAGELKRSKKTKHNQVTFLKSLIL